MRKLIFRIQTWLSYYEIVFLIKKSRKKQSMSEEFRQPQENQALPPPSSEELQRRPIKENHLKQVVEPPKAETANEGGASSFEEFM